MIWSGMLFSHYLEQKYSWMWLYVKNVLEENGNYKQVVSSIDILYTVNYCVLILYLQPTTVCWCYIYSQLLCVDNISTTNYCMLVYHLQQTTVCWYFIFVIDEWRWLDSDFSSQEAGNRLCTSPPGPGSVCRLRGRILVKNFIE